MQDVRNAVQQLSLNNHPKNIFRQINQGDHFRSYFAQWFFPFWTVVTVSEQKEVRTPSISITICVCCLTEELEAVPHAPVLGKPVEDEPDEKEVESEEDEEENSETRSLTAISGGAHTSSAWAGRTVTLQMLLSTGILKPEKASMAIEYMGQKFVGDLLPDGKIKSVETETVFCSPSAWAINCKRIINPEKKSGCGWSSVKYKGKKLDHYKQMYLRKMQSQKEPSDGKSCGILGSGQPSHTCYSNR